MSQVFHPSANSIARMSILGVIVLVIVIGGVAALYLQASFYTFSYVVLDQPVPFSHQRHVGGNGLDCRYCHTTVEVAANSGIPPTETCLTCHSTILKDSPMIEPLWESQETGKPIEWNRVHDLPDYVYYNHSIHIAKGIGCTTCHDKVQNMRLTWKGATLQMGWCLECHRNPEKFIRPKEEVFNVNWEAPDNQLEMGKELVKEYDIKVKQLTDCSVCHR